MKWIVSSPRFGSFSPARLALSCVTSAAFAFAAMAGRAVAEEGSRQPPPEFETGYRPPDVFQPAPRAELFGWVDMAVLAGTLLLGAYFILVRRSRRETRLLTLFAALYFGFYRQGCICAVGSIQNVALAAGDAGYALPLAAGFFFLLPLLFALFAGRVFCAAACPLGALQDLVLLKPRKVPAWLDDTLGVVPYLYLGAAVLFAVTGSAFVICEYDPFISFFRLGGGVGVVALGTALLLIGTMIGRPYCRWLCPYGVLLRWMAPFARWRVTITPSRCIQCHLCADSCPFGAIRAPSSGENGVSDSSRRRGDRRRLTLLVALLPVFMLAGAGVGYLASPAISRVDSTVRLAERVWLEERGRVKGTTDASDAFRKNGQPESELYREALDLRRRFDVGAALLGGWIGLVIGGRLVFLSIRRRRDDYEADPAACLSCARCYSACPVDRDGSVDELIRIELPVEARDRISAGEREPARMGREESRR